MEKQLLLNGPPVAEGGFGSVFKVPDLDVDECEGGAPCRLFLRTVAIKVHTRGSAEDQAEAFGRELWASSELSELWSCQPATHFACGMPGPELAQYLGLAEGQAVFAQVMPWAKHGSLRSGGASRELCIAARLCCAGFAAARPQPPAQPGHPPSDAFSLACPVARRWSCCAWTWWARTCRRCAMRCAPSRSPGTTTATSSPRTSWWAAGAFEKPREAVRACNKMCTTSVWMGAPASCTASGPDTSHPGLQVDDWWMLADFGLYGKILRGWG